MKVLLADKREIFRRGLAKLLEYEPNIELVSTCSSGAEVIEKTKKLRPDIILLDTEISNCDFIEAIRSTVRLLPETRIIMLTHSEEAHDLFSALKVGAKAYISKDIKVKDLISIIENVYAGGVIISPPMATRLLEEFASLEEAREMGNNKHNVDLSKRETEVLELVAKGLTNKQIADTLFISENTVKAHLSKILEKMHVQTRQQAAYAIKAGILFKVTGPDK